MAQIETWIDTDIKKGVAVTKLGGNMFRQDNQANKIGVRVYDDGSPVTLTGTISGKVIIPDGTTVTVAGTISGNAAYIVLPSSVYANKGRIAVFIKNVVGSVVTTLAALEATIM